VGNKEIKSQNKGAVLVQIAQEWFAQVPCLFKLLLYLVVNPTFKICLQIAALFISIAPLFISQPHIQNQSVGGCYHTEEEYAC